MCMRCAGLGPMIATRSPLAGFPEAARAGERPLAIDEPLGPMPEQVLARAGLRVSEVASLKVSDIDSKRMLLRIEQGKGRKDRYAMLSPVRPRPAARSVQGPES
jgi:integrase